ncbi:MAG: SGNH/GDSL hydrolase family protein [Pseudomonadota bacterium]
MKNPGMRRLLVAVAAAASVVLASCGGGDVVGAITPSRIVAFGDAFSDVGQSGNKYTVNDGSINNWTQQVAQRYGVPLASQASGGNSLAQGNVRVLVEPDATGSSTTRTVKEQVDAFLGAGSFAAGDLVFIGGGFSDIIAETVNTALTDAQREANVQQAGRDLAAQVRRLVAANAKQIILTGVYDLGRTPWARSMSSAQQSAISNLSSRFNEALIVALVDLGSSVLYIDSANYFNLLTNQPTSFNLDTSNVVACTATASGSDGIGISTGPHVSSKVCTGGTITAGVDFNRTVYADSVYPTPIAHRLFGDVAFDRIRTRF